MYARARSQRGESGETLIELLVAMVIIGTAVVALTTGLGASILNSAVHRQHATADASARSVAECLKDRTLVYQENGNYPSCNTAGVTVTPRWWNGNSPATFGSSPNANGVQALDVTATSARTSEAITVVKRRT